MSVIWENDEIKDRILLLSPNLQESFLRAVDALHNRESDFMLTFIKESRDELRDTHEEIEREQEILRDTSDLLASKRMYGDPDDWEDDKLEGNAVDEYLRRRNQGDVLGIISFEDERKARKKQKKREKDRDKRSNSVNETRGSSAFSAISEMDKKREKKHKKDKHRVKEPVSAWGDEPSDSIILEKDRDKEKEKEKKHKKEKKKDKERKERSRSRDGLKMEREKTLDSIKEASKDQAVIEKQTNALMQDFISRETSNIEQKNQFEEAMKKKLAAKKNKRAAEADIVMQQQIAAEKAVSDAKADFEAKMMEKLRAKREASGLSRPPTNLGTDSNIIVENEVNETKKKKEKKKKKHKNKEKVEEGAGNDDDGEKKEKKEKKKKKKKDKEKELEEL